MEIAHRTVVRLPGNLMVVVPLAVAVCTMSVSATDQPPMDAAPGQPLSSTLFLPSVQSESGVRSMPRPVASLGQSVHDILLLDGVLYAALGRTVAAFDARPGNAFAHLGVTDMLPGAVVDLVAGSGVVYAAYSAGFDGTTSGGLAVVEQHRRGDLDVLGLFEPAPGAGYISLASDGATVVGVRCGSDACEGLDVIDATEPSTPMLADAVTFREPINRSQWTRIGVAALGQGRFTDGSVVLDASEPRATAVLGVLPDTGFPEAGFPVASDDVLVTLGAEQLHLYSLEGAGLPQPVHSADWDAESSMYALTAAAIVGGRLLAGGSPDKYYAGKGMWVEVPIQGGELGAVEVAEADQVPAAFSSTPDSIWIAMNDGADWGNQAGALDPYRPSIAQLPLGAPAPPRSNLTPLWTGWDWRVLDVVRIGSAAYAIEQGSDTSAVDLVTYDISVGSQPLFVQRTSGVCDGSNGWEPWSAWLRWCTVAQLAADTLAVSSVLGATIIDVSDPWSPRAIRSVDSLGIEIASVPGGIVGLFPHERSQPDDEIVGFELGDDGSAVRVWTVPLGIAVAEFDVDSGSGLVVASSGFEIWAGRASALTGVSQSTTRPCPDGCYGVTAASDRAYLVEFHRSSDAAVFREMRLNSGGIETVGHTTFEFPSDTANYPASPIIWDGTYVIGIDSSLAFVDVRDRGSPKQLGHALYGPGLCALNMYWCDLGVSPVLVDLGSYLYVTLNPFGEVWR